jgi:hypothetical protein
MPRLILVALFAGALAFTLIAPRCGGGPATVYITPHLCDGGVPLELEWAYGRLTVAPGECVRMALSLAEETRLCCGELCSEKAVPCVPPCPACERCITKEGLEIACPT